VGREQAELSGWPTKHSQSTRAFDLQRRRILLPMDRFTAVRAEKEYWPNIGFGRSGSASRINAE
jgi:hypothetical protein